MDSQTYYLKYRPQKVSELDLKEVRESLEKILKSGKIPHAFLFSGPKGTGKTSAARIIAKAINCLRQTQSAKRKAQSFEPCNKCEICQEITAGTALDLIEIDAASNRGIDDIRNLREKIKLSPAKCLHKVYIIDEAHMLTTEAFNALLKTLEEPPAHAIFILCTTAPEKLPKTIISRCVQINFPKASLGEIKRCLERVVKGEKLKVEEGVLGEIGRSVDGSFRDAHKILEQLAMGGEKITLAETKKLLGQIEELSPRKLLNLLLTKDVTPAFLEIDRIVKIGGDLSIYSQNLLEELRLMLLETVGVEIENRRQLNTQVWKVVESLKRQDIIHLIGLFSQAALEIKTSPIPQLPLELAVVEWCEGEKEGVRAPLFSETRAEVKGKEKSDSPSLSDPPIQKSDGKLDLNQTADQSSSKRVPSPPSRGGDLDEILEKWSDLLANVKPLNHSVEALLRAARPVKLDGEFLTLEVFYKFHKERLETDKCRLVVEEVASQILGTPIKLKCVLGEKRNTDDTDKAIKPTDDTDETDGNENDIIEIAADIFNGKLID